MFVVQFLFPKFKHQSIIYMVEWMVVGFGPDTSQEAIHHKFNLQIDRYFCSICIYICSLNIYSLQMIYLYHGSRGWYMFHILSSNLVLHWNVVVFISPYNPHQPEQSVFLYFLLDKKWNSYYWCYISSMWHCIKFAEIFGASSTWNKFFCWR